MIDKTPKMFPQFIQIAFNNNGTLYALDDSGDIYRRDQYGKWHRQVGRGENIDDES